MMKLSIGTRPFPLWFSSYNKSYFDGLEGKEKAYNEVGHLCSHAVIVTCGQRNAQLVDNPGRSDTKYRVRMKGSPVSSKGCGDIGCSQRPLYTSLRARKASGRKVFGGKTVFSNGRRRFRQPAPGLI
jgi:hypothetical protein